MAVDRYDKFCPFYKSVWMMRNIIHFYNLANQVDFLFVQIDCIWLIEDFLLCSTKGSISLSQLRQMIGA